MCLAQVSIPLIKSQRRQKEALTAHLLGNSHVTSCDPPNKSMRQVTCLAIGKHRRREDSGQGHIVDQFSAHLDRKGGGVD